MERSHRHRWALGPLTATALVLALSACSSGTKALTEDAFVSEMNSICRTGDRAIGKLDPADSSFASDAVDIMTTAFDDLIKLAPPKTLKADFDDYTNNLDDQITQATKLQKAIKAKDDAAAQKAAGKLDTLSTDSDSLAESIGADKCVGVGAGDSSSDTTPGSTADSAPPNTPLPLVTTPIETAPLNTSGSSGSTDAYNLDGVLTPPTGYTWEAVDDPYDASALFADPVLGSAVKSYGYGKLRTTDGTLAEVYIISMNADWTQPQIDAYLQYEGVADGVDITTPAGLSARQKTAAFTGADAVVVHDGAIGVSVVTQTGTDGSPILDAIVYAGG